MKITRRTVIVSALVILGLTFLVIGVLMQRDPPVDFGHSLRHPQLADSAPGYPVPIEGENSFTTAQFEPNLSTLSPLERALLPTARGFINPHGQPLAAATGLILYCGKPDGYPGHAVLLGHRLPDGRIVTSFYANLSHSDLLVGDYLPRSAPVGTSENSAIFFELREGPAIDIAREVVAGVTLNDAQSPPAPNRLNLDDFFAEFGLPENAPPDPLALILEKENEALRSQLPLLE